jgi:hypothetical protein
VYHFVVEDQTWRAPGAPTRKLNRIAIALLLAQPPVVGAGAAFASSLVDHDSTPGLADPDQELNNLSDHWVVVH